jgi:Cd2+/Zn2+-exporting ATPase
LKFLPGFQIRHEEMPHKPARSRRDADAGQSILHVADVDCAEEVATIKRALKPVSGVSDVRVNVLSGKTTISHDSTVTPELLIRAIADAGLKATRDAGKKESSDGQSQRRRLISIAISGLFTVTGLVVHWVELGPEWPHIALFFGAILTGGWFIFPKAVGAARRLAPDMNLLMSIAVIGAAIIGQWSEAAAVTFLFGLSELLETFSVQRARRAIESLLNLVPETALVKRGDAFEELLVEQVGVGDVIAVKSGMRVPLDGEIALGTSSINQAPITGESMPVEKEEGDEVFAGTINGQGSLEVRVTKPASNTALAKIIQLVEEAQDQKAPSQRFVDVFAHYYTPSVIVLALLVLFVPPLLFHGAWFTWIYRALVLLVIACPCALVISTPVSIVSGLTAMARRGVLIKGGAFLEAIGKLRALALDKTGTITEGKPRVTKVISVDSNRTEEIVRVAAGIDTHSEHPLAQAVVDYAQKQGIGFVRSENYKAHSGRGATATIDNHEFFVGNHRLAHELAVCSEELEELLKEIEGQAQSVVVVGHMPHPGCKGEVLGVLAITDTVRSNATAAISSLHSAGVGKIIMLSGDNQRTVDAIAKEAGIDEAEGELLPDQKIDRVKELMKRERFVGMVGDGVNDAPAMAAATVGIAMGAVGTDTVIETADIALMKDDLAKIAQTIMLGRRTVRVIVGNIVFALAVKALFLGLALFGYTSLWLAIAADTGATLIVIANALRLLKA